jgi:hypothetical protein
MPETGRERQRRRRSVPARENSTPLKLISWEKPVLAKCPAQIPAYDCPDRKRPGQTIKQFALFRILRMLTCLFAQRVVHLVIPFHVLPPMHLIAENPARKPRLAVISMVSSDKGGEQIDRS